MGRLQRTEKLYRLVEKFIEEQDIICVECIYQQDNVIQNAYEFIEQCCDIVGYKEFEEE
jgi:hypothetical protein